MAKSRTVKGLYWTYSKLIDTRTVRTVLSIQHSESGHGELPYYNSQRSHAVYVRSTMMPGTGVETSLATNCQ